MREGLLRNALGFGAAGGALGGGLGQLGSQGFLGDLSDIVSAPGGYARGLLAGNPGERMGGRELLRQYGLVGEEDTWSNFLGGLGTDFMTDPLTYGGAIAGAGGKIARNLMSPTLQESRLAELAGRAGMVTGLPDETLTMASGMNKFHPPPLDGLPKGPIPHPLLETGMPGMSPQLPMDDFLNPQVMAQLDDMALRTGSRNATWDAMAQARQQLAAPSMPTPPSMPPPMAPSMMAGEGLPWSPMMNPPEFPSMQLPKTNPMMMSPPPLAAASPQMPPFALPEGMPLNAGLLPETAYGPQAMGNVTPILPGAANTYQRVSPEVRALLEALGIPPEMQSTFARGALPPWAQVRGGNVMMAPGMLPQDVARGARTAAGYS